VDRVNLERAIGQLPPGYRAVFVLHDVQGYEHNEIADIMDCSVGNRNHSCTKLERVCASCFRRAPATRPGTNGKKQKHKHPTGIELHWAQTGMCESDCRKNPLKDLNTVRGQKFGKVREPGRICLSRSEEPCSVRTSRRS